MNLIEKYQQFVEKYGREDEVVSSASVTQEVRSMIIDFMHRNKKVALYCYGEHTEMLLAEFVFELKGIVCIIDNYIDNRDNTGYRIIKENEIEENQIDGVIISSFVYRESIAQSLEKNHPSVQVLDIYQGLESKGIFLKYSYYQTDHPFHNYKEINRLQRKLACETSKDNRQLLLKKIVYSYVHIKDFATAIKKGKELVALFPSSANRVLLNDLQEIYNIELKEAEKISDNNVLMLCIDALRAEDFSESSMPKVFSAVSRKGFIYKNAYAYSTSTYESLVPVYSENSDQKTHYYEKDSIKGCECSFFREAKKQGRNIYFYTDMGEYIEDEEIIRTGRSQTTTEKIWNFIVDAANEDNGLFYIHNSFESHFSFANPYTEAEIVVGGQNILYDYLEQKGGKLRTDYVKQHNDAIRYIDDIIGPILERLNIRMLLFADHGTFVLDRAMSLDEVDDSLLVCHEQCIRIPLAVISPEKGVGTSNGLVSLMDFNKMMLALLNKTNYKDKTNKWIKIGRSAIYNPEFKTLYMRKNLERGLLAFEGFIFGDLEIKLIVYSDGKKEIYSTESDELIDDVERVQELYNIVKKDVTVC